MKEELIKLKNIEVVPYEKPDENDIRKYIGKVVEIEGKKILIETICGNKIKPAFFEINNAHLIGMLRFFAQMNGDRSIPEKEFREFEEMVHWVEKKKSVIEVPHDIKKFH